MKTSHFKFNAVRGLLAMTLVEMLTTMGLFTVAVASLVSINMVSLQQDELINSKLGASDQARLNFDLMINEIRSGKDVQIGYGNYTNFVATTNGLQQGDTIQILPCTNIAVYIYYYFITNAPTNSSWLCRAVVTNTLDITGTYVVSSNILQTNTVAQYLTNMTVNVGTNHLITNAMVFSALAYNGSTFAVLTNDPAVYTTHNYLVDVLLQFYQYQYPMTKVGSNYLYDYYQVELTAARRAE